MIKQDNVDNKLIQIENENKKEIEKLKEEDKKYRLKFQDIFERLERLEDE